MQGNSLAGLRRKTKKKEQNKKIERDGLNCTDSK